MNRRTLIAPLAALLLAACTPPNVANGSLPSPPPWPRPSDTAAAVKKAGLEILPTEHLNYHIHSQLNVFYQGEVVTVPANIGIDDNGLSILHTHDPSGLIHIESPEKRDFTLGQFFTEWNVPLTGAVAYVDGKQVPDPAAIVLADGQKITVSYGPLPNPLPAVPIK